MRRLLILSIIFLIANLSFAQNDVYKTNIDEFEKNYNSNNFEKIFDSFASEMQSSLPINKTSEFLLELKMQVGKIIKSEFIEFKDKNSSSYNITFEKATLLLNISVDERGKISGLLFKPLEDKRNFPENVTNSLDGISKELSENIFNRTKHFPNKTQVSIALIENERVIFYGVKKENDTIKFADNKDDNFEIGSITKVFTATVLADLVVRNKINIEDNINEYFNFPFNDKTKIRFIDLANHTSGVQSLPSNLDLMTMDQNNPFKEYDKFKLNSYLKEELILEKKSGERYSYSNLGMGLLGYTLGISQKSNYKQLLKKSILEKYQMTNTFTDKSEIKHRLIKGLDSKGNEVENWDFDALFAAGGILSNVEDLSKFAVAQFNPSNKELALTRNPTFTVNENMKIALGWHIIKLESGKETYWHNGGTGGYSSSMALDIENKTGVVILSNVSAFNSSMNNIDSLCFELMKNFEIK